MKKFLSVTLILALALTLCLSFVACKGDSQDVDKLTEIKYETLLADYLSYPDAANDAKMATISRNVTEIFNDSSLSDAQKIAQIMDRATKNEIECAYFSFFRNQVGETKIGGNSGQLVYQRFRKQSDTLKDDTTIKLPINHNFGALESNFVTSADIRYVNNGKYNRMSNKSNIVYNKDTGLLEVEQWKKHSKWNIDEEAKWSRSYDEARKTCINWNVENIVDSAKTISLTLKQDENNNEYYELVFSVNVGVANADSTTIKRLEEDNGGKDMKYEYCNFVIQIWKNGLAKKYQIDESWSGKIGGIYSGSAQSKSEIVFSYSERDLDNSKTESIYQGILNR
ncbi:MAG: hypothetical protein K2L70_06355 [Clostridia bacterium]|nr:hypothetical protein [Clostridia bacterium]